MSQVPTPDDIAAGMGDPEVDIFDVDRHGEVRSRGASGIPVTTRSIYICNLD